ncbi:MerR family transcriptional regulator [Synergistes jonesii]|uniref:Transcriptional regulator n=1 Tax=Synergistes jonesii TaxID=2754 RepID=A0A073IRN3_9BACT|nr:MerR family transcriptional regulator [Synergistes jonesii]KEJ92235.1 transcriptional regulator [Synergistes jonesii]OFB62688.1 transcriptional regulator [Synergistes jonesii]OFB63395.1 transcriptional regulator [Synergistes jonesii]OFB65562.1 transcriptional regulator [Synergistes jonesii]OFB67633.1 transcriptional regulator [Synergistes jonesii]
MKISEVSEKYGLSADTLRYYERIGLLPRVPRNSAGVRDYGEKECSWVEFVRYMRGAGLSVEALTRYIRLAQEGEDTAEERRDILIGQREMLKGKIAVLQEALDKLNYKIDVFYGKMRECEKNLQERA